MVEVLLLLVGALSAAVFFLWRGRNRDASRGASIGAELPSQRESLPSTLLPAVADSGADPEPLLVPQKVVVTKGSTEVMSLSVVDKAAFSSQRKRATKVEPRSFGHALEPLLQIAPAMTTAAMANGKQLMEVVVNGSLVAASDGNGLRAIAMGANGIKEHARLYQPSNLQNVANAAAIWQLASVVVAQKHLADISATLRIIEGKVDGIQSFLEEQRLAVIRSASNYLATAKAALEQGEFLDRTRQMLEQLDLDLDRAALSLIDQIRRESQTELERDSVGCEGEYRSAKAKHERLTARLQELTLCQEVRMANWYMCALYADRSQILAPRLQQLKASVAETVGLKSQLEDVLRSDCLKIDATFTSDDTIAQRRSEVRASAAPGHEALEWSRDWCNVISRRVDAVTQDRQVSGRILIEATNGSPTALYLCDMPKSTITVEPKLQEAPAKGRKPAVPAAPMI